MGNGTIGGTVQVNLGSELTLGGGVIEVTGNLTNDATVTISDGFVFFNGNITTSSNMVLESSLIFGSNFTNSGNLSSLGTCGQINVLNTSQNSGSVDANTAQLDICDSSNSDSNPFDTNSGTIAGTPTICECATALPVSLVSFEAEASENAIQLNWVTASEYNSSYFIVQRSTDGQLFEDLVEINALGYSSHTHQYQYIDEEGQSLIVGHLYYRLKQVDTDKIYCS